MQSLRIAFLTGSLGMGGAEKQLVYLVRALHKAGVELHLFTLAEHGYYEPALQNLGIPLVWIGQSGNELRRLQVLVSHMRAFKPHIIHAGQLYSSFYVGAAGRLTGGLSFGNMRSNLANSQRMGRIRFWLATKTPTAIIANSQTALDELQAIGIRRADTLYLLNNVIDLDAFDAQLSPNSPATQAHDNIQVAFVGRLRNVKRIDRFLEALHLARQQAPNVTGLIAGEGPEQEKLQQYAGELGLLPDGVRFLGARDDVPAILNNSHMLVLCSDHEGFSNVLLEAMAARRPVITTPAGDSTMVVQDQKTGLVADFDPQSIATHIVTLAQNSTLRQQLGTAGRARVETHYSFEGLHERTLDIYMAAAQKQGRQNIAQLTRNHV